MGAGQQGSRCHGVLHAVLGVYKVTSGRGCRLHPDMSAPTAVALSTKRERPLCQTEPTSALFCVGAAVAASVERPKHHLASDADDPVTQQSAVQLCSTAACALQDMAADRVLCWC
jgi:hypothetical protein